MSKVSRVVYYVDMFEEKEAVLWRQAIIFYNLIILDYNKKLLWVHFLQNH